MAKTLAQRLLREEDERKWRYSGTRDELIAAGLAQPGDFPGDPGGPIYSGMIKRDDRRTHISIHSRVADPITFWVRVFKTPVSEEKAKRKEGRKGREAKRSAEWAAKRREDAESARRSAAAKLADLPSSGSEYLNRAVSGLRIAVSHLRAALVGNGYLLGELDSKLTMDGYRIDAESLSAFDDAIDEAVSALRSARAIPDKRSRGSAVISIRGEAAKADPEFRSFMREIAPADSHARNG